MRSSIEKSYLLSREILPKKIEVNGENINHWRGRVSRWRETMGMEGALLLKVLPALRKEAAKEGLWSHVVGLWHEQALVGKHFFRLEKVLQNKRLPGGVVARHIGAKIMNWAVRESDKILTEHGDVEGMDFLRRRQGRFRGDVLTQDGKYSQAIKELDESINLFHEVDNPVIQANTLEIQGFKAEALIRSGDLEAGLKLGFTTFAKYSSGKSGQALKEADESTWANWRAGCIAKMARALLDTHELESLSPAEEKMHFLNSFQLASAPKLLPMREQEMKNIWSELQNAGFTHDVLGNLSQT